SRYVHIKAKNFGSLQPGIAYIIRVTDPGHGFTCNVAAVLKKRENICENLAGMILIGQPVDDRYSRILCKPLDDLMLMGTNGDDIHHPRDNPGSIFYRFATSQLGIACGKINSTTAQLVHSRFE